jgi:hypothetical protein
MMQLEQLFEEEDMLKYISFLLHDTDLAVDQVRDRFTDRYGEENLHILEEVLDEQ